MSIDYSSAVGQVRALIQDIDETDLMLSDDVIALVVPGGSLGQSSIHLAAAESARMIGAKFARRANSISEGGASVNWGDLSKKFYDLAAKLRADDEASASGDAEGLFDWAEQVPDQFSARERMRNEILRDQI